MMNQPAYEIVDLQPGTEGALLEFLAALSESGDDAEFHPHSFTRQAIDKINARKKDIYLLLVDNEGVAGYGMLRGWDEGYDIPSLGIAIHPRTRRQGLGRILMGQLHERARLAGAGQVRLKVYKTNRRAVQLYEELGYEFTGSEGDQLVGYVTL